MPYELRRTAAFIGMMGAGKTAVGTAVARKLDVPFVDQDTEIERAANRTIAEIFRDYGEAFFREKETRVLSRLVRGAPCILSTGGGAFLSPRNRAIIAESGIAVWLDADLSLLWARVRHRSTRPLLKTDQPFQTLKTLYEARAPVYALAPVHVRSQPRFSVEDTADAVIATLLSHPDTLRNTDDVSQR